MDETGEQASEPAPRLPSLSPPPPPLSLSLSLSLTHSLSLLSPRACDVLIGGWGYRWLSGACAVRGIRISSRSLIKISHELCGAVVD